ncbi:MAG: hypothetical protein WCO53_13650 [Deltaproteobacteria bacterium]
MRTDEYEISMYREIDVCKRMIIGLKNTLAVIESKHNKSSNIFLKELESGNDSDCKDDCREWKENYDALKRWEEKLSQYEVLYLSDKIDS